MTDNKQAILFNRILKNQIVMMSAIEEIRRNTGNSISQFQNIPETIQETKDVRRIVSYVDDF